MASDACHFTTGGHGHIPWDGHGWYNFDGMGETVACLTGIAREVLMAFSAGDASLFAIGQFFSVEGEGLMAVKALGVSLVVMDGEGRQGGEKGDCGKENDGARYLHSEKSPVACRRSAIFLARSAREVSSSLCVASASARIRSASSWIFVRR